MMAGTGGAMSRGGDGFGAESTSGGGDHARGEWPWEARASSAAESGVSTAVVLGVLPVVLGVLPVVLGVLPGALE